jgi:hypothetical protein
MSVIENESENLESVKEVPQNINIDTNYDDLEVILRDLPLNDRALLSTKLTRIYVNGHIYHNQWENFKFQSILLENVVDMVQKYESNGLQLHGHACWILVKLIDISPNLLSSTRHSEQIILELILRIIVEHSNHITLITIFRRLVDHDPTKFSMICKIGNNIIIYICAAE